MKSKRWFLVLTVGWFLALAGCGEFYELYSISYKIDTDPVFERYHQTTLKFSSSADVLATIHDPGTEFLSQSESVVASWGEKKKGSVVWFNAVAFDEEELTAVRKYAFAADEKVKGFYVRAVKKLRFNAQAVLSEALLEEPYANENTRRIAVLNQVLAGFNEDLGQLTPDSRTLESAVMMARQVMNMVLIRLDSNPALAVKLSDPDGLAFDHMTLGKARIALSIDGDIADVRIKVATDRWDRPQKP